MKLYWIRYGGQAIVVRAQDPRQAVRLCCCAPDATDEDADRVVGVLRAEGRLEVLQADGSPGVLQVHY